ncbi:GTPase ObgE [Candidatus Cytomitobacter indipagum]|uniref:GTPase Obg n=1 Tax=Candidatus Cytomitobacter indipagum TaxID=2601575 RepID=A0A5C0UEQ7_9PROT|nr:GTPase ObgE [Candidatus Cytomitobacter indipagum]QEK38123.1 GTPase ObgE [Candidatus Cytomitobacter indipagum]
MNEYIDRVGITVKAGNGGNGCISFRRERSAPNGGPNGGDGGKGGNIYIKGNHNLNSLMDFRYKKHWKAENGRDGETCLCTGRSGDDLIIQVPFGTQVYENGQLICEILNENQVILVKGGKRGLGNKRFARPDFQVPRIATDGDPGEEKELKLILKQIADVGVVGKPNAGKSTLVHVVSNAPVIIADYPFSTLKPKLANVKHHDQSMTFIDIPGLIEKAHEGKGLGHQFLQHIERCKVLLHLADISSDTFEEDIDCIINEIKQYDSELLKRMICICLTKCDLVDEEEIEEAKAKAKKRYENVICLASWDKTGINEMLNFVHNELKRIDELKKIEELEKIEELRRVEELEKIEKLNETKKLNEEEAGSCCNNSDSCDKSDSDKLNNDDSGKD